MPPRPVPMLANLPILPIGESGVPGVDRVVPLANNENTQSPSPAVLAACAEAAGRSNFYPDVGHTVLRRQIAARYGGLDPDRIVCGIGSSELIGLLAQAYCGAGDQAVIGRQGYLYFTIATRATGAEPVYAGSDRLGNRPGFDLDAALDAVTPKTRIVFLDNPSNPLGSIVRRDDLIAFRARLRDDILLVLDGAYADYVDDPDFEPGEALVEESDNVVVFRTFSKIYGLAGLRVGWGYVPDGVAQAIRQVQRPGNVSVTALAAAQVALSETGLIAERKRRNAEIRDRFTGQISAVPGLSVLPSQTNFVFTTVTPDAVIDAAELFERAKAKGVLLRPMAPYGQPDSLRITIGSEEEMSIAADVIAGAMAL